MTFRLITLALVALLPLVLAMTDQEAIQACQPDVKKYCPSYLGVTDPAILFDSTCMTQHSTSLSSACSHAYELFNEGALVHDSPSTFIHSPHASAQSYQDDNTGTIIAICAGTLGGLVILGTVIVAVVLAFKKLRKPADSQEFGYDTQSEQVPVFSDHEGNLFVFQDTDNTV